MYKISEQTPIDIWENIADAVQTLDISSCTPQEFKKNLSKLKNLLKKSDLCLEELKIEPSNEEEIGLASLLASIYNSDADIKRKKSKFYENIYTLSDLGVKSIEFKPISFYRAICGISNSEEISDKNFLTKFFTDGDFYIPKFPFNGDGCFLVDDLERANYIINVSLSEINNIINVDDAQAILKNFNGRYPTKEEFLKMMYTKMIIPSQSICFGEEPTNIYQSFEKADVRDVPFTKKLTQTKDGQYYYEKK